MLDAQVAAGLTWVHFGDLHITDENAANNRDFLEIIDAINTHLARDIDFCFLPGDNADDGNAEQYALVRRGFDRLQMPVHIIPGDHDRKAGNLDAFYSTLGAARLRDAIALGRYRCLFLDVVSNGTGGPDFSLGSEQMQWVEQQLESANAAGQMAVVFMHAYPADLKRGGEELRWLLRRFRVKVVDMGHTHYNELTNDGTTIFATTRSTGQIEEGPVGFSIVTLHGGVVTWRFKPLRSPWPLVAITSPADHRLVTDVTLPNQIVSRSFTAIARSWVARTVQAPALIADGSDADAVDPWPERHILGTRFGPNRNGRQW